MTCSRSSPRSERALARCSSASRSSASNEARHATGSACSTASCSGVASPSISASTYMSNCQGASGVGVGVPVTFLRWIPRRPRRASSKSAGPKALPVPVAPWGGPKTETRPLRVNELSTLVSSRRQPLYSIVGHAGRPSRTRQLTARPAENAVLPQPTVGRTFAAVLREIPTDSGHTASLRGGILRTSLPGGKEKPALSELSGRRSSASLLLDDQTIFREGLRALIEQEPDLEVVAQAADRGRAGRPRRRTPASSSPASSLPDARRERGRRHGCAPASPTRRSSRSPCSTISPTVHAGARGRRRRLRPEVGDDGRPLRRYPHRRSRRRCTCSRRSASRSRRARPTRSRSPERRRTDAQGDRRPPPPRARAHERRDRATPRRQPAHDRDASRAHSPEARPAQPRASSCASRSTPGSCGSTSRARRPPIAESPTARPTPCPTASDLGLLTPPSAGATAARPAPRAGGRSHPR